MNCSGKFLVPIVIWGGGGWVAVCLGVSLPSPPQPVRPTSAIRRAAGAAVYHLMRTSGYGWLVARAVRCRGLDGQGEPEGAALARLALGPDPAAVLLDDPLAHREPDAGSGVGALAVKAVERLEDLLRLRLLHADPVVAHGEPPRAVDSARRDLHVRVALGELHGVRDQVLEDLAEIAVVGADDGHLPHLDRRARLLDRPREHVQHLVEHALDADLLLAQLAASGARVLEQ